MNPNIPQRNPQGGYAQNQGQQPIQPGQGRGQPVAQSTVSYQS